MKKFSYIYIILAYILCFCTSKSKDYPSIDLNAINRIDMQKSFGGFTIDQAINVYDSYFLLFDRIQQRVLKVDQSFGYVEESFDLKNTILENSDFYGFDIIGNRLFLRASSSFVVFNLDNNKYIGTFKNPFPFSNQLFEFNKHNYSTVLFKSDITVVRYLWNDIDGFIDIEEVVKIPSKRPTIDVDLSGWLLRVGNNMGYVDDWSGEYSVIDIEKKSIVNEGRLPLGGPIEENYESDESNLNFGTYKNAYSITQRDDNSFFILREVDWEISSSNEIDLDLESDKKRIRRRIHLFDNNFSILKSYQLENYANCIFYDNNKLIGSHTGDEEFYVYETIY
jgi:hypothetical protein